MFDDLDLNSLGGCSEAVEGTTALRERGRTRSLQRASSLSWEVMSLNCKFQSLFVFRFGF